MGVESGVGGQGGGSNRTPGQGLGPLRRHLGQSEEPGRLWEAVMHASISGHKETMYSVASSSS